MSVRPSTASHRQAKGQAAIDTLHVTQSWPQLPALRAGESSACSLSYCRLLWLCFPCMHVCAYPKGFWRQMHNR